MSRTLVVGGHGKVALLLTPLLIERGDEVTGLIRNPAHEADVVAAGASAQVGNIEQMGPDEWDGALTGFDAVVWSAGAGGGDPARTLAVDRDAAIASMDAAQRAGVDRYVMVSYLGARLDHGVDPANSFFAYAEAKAAADSHLRSTDLAWTIAGPGRLTLDSPTGLIDVTDAEAGAGLAQSSVARADVAAVVAAILARPDTIRRTIGFNNGSTPIAEALLLA